MNTTPFRLKDVITGLYYIPCRQIKVQNKYIKSNLSKKGKIYFNDPRKHITDFLDHTQLRKSATSIGFRSSVRQDIENLIIEEL